MSRYLLHIGRQKSGTTSLQKFFSDRVAELKTCSVWYPESGRVGTGHHGIAKALNAKTFASDPLKCEAEVKAFRSQLDEEVSTWTGRILLSSEAFQSSEPLRVATLFPPDQSTVVVYLREQADYFVSTYMERVHASQLHPALAGPKIAGRFDYNVFLGRWEAAYPLSKVTVRVYDPSQWRHGSVIDDFLQATDIPLSPPEGRHDRNPSIGGALLEFKRIYNRWGGAESASQATYQAFSLIAGMHDRFRQKPALPPAVVSSLREKLAESNARVAQRYFGRKDLFAQPPVAPVPPVVQVADFSDAIEALKQHSPVIAEKVLLALIASRQTDSARAAERASRIFSMPQADRRHKVGDLIVKLDRHKDPLDWRWNFGLETRH